MVVFLSAIAILVWIAFLLAATALGGIIWATCKAALWLMDPKPRPTQLKSKPNAPLRPAASPKPAAAPAPPRPGVNRSPDRPGAGSHTGPDIWPKWTPSHRLYKANELALWQEQFDRLDSATPRG